MYLLLYVIQIKMKSVTRGFGVFLTQGAHNQLGVVALSTHSPRQRMGPLPGNAA